MEIVLNRRVFAELLVLSFKSKRRANISLIIVFENVQNT